MMIFADRVVAFDHDGAEIFLLALAAIDDDGPARAWIDGTERRLATCRRVAPASEPIAESLAGPRPRHSRGEYLRLIEECQRQIRDGETYEVCLTNMLEVAGRLDAWPAYRVLRRDNPAPYAAFLRFGGLAVLSSSPERFLRIGVDHLVESKPIKGTRARGATAADDRRIVAELAGSVKDRAENLMIVDLVRHDLGSCAEPGSVRVTRMFDVETYRTVHQLVSTVRATIREGLTAVDCVRAAFPGGSMTGAPKIRTLSIIDALERGPRGVYSGAIGYFSLSGSADLGMTIRTVVAEPELMRYGVGGAIVALSDPAAEYHETEIKAAPLLALIAQRFPDEPA
jgi:para-aminobenzoate synthetase